MATRFYLSPRRDKRDECPIRVSVSIRGTRLLSTAGISIAREKWNAREQRVKKGQQNADGISSGIINTRLKEIDASFARYELELNHRPEPDELAEHLATIKGANRRKQRPDKAEEAAVNMLDRFIEEESKNAQWAQNTLLNFHNFRKHLLRFRHDVLLSEFNESGLARFIDYLRNQAGLSETSVRNEYRFLGWFLRWCIRKGYTRQDAILHYQPKFRTLPKPVIFLRKEELIRLYQLQIPGNETRIQRTGKLSGEALRHTDMLRKARDFFCFCAFTSLRYSDAAALKKSDICGDCLQIVTKKTADALTIELNRYAKSILNRYADIPGIFALPRISLPCLDGCIKELGKLCGFNEPISRTVFRAGKRTDRTMEKWRLLSSHAGRRTFICCALGAGIPPQVVMKWTGHSDYKAMQPYIDIADTTKQQAMRDFTRSMEEEHEQGNRV